MRAHIYVKGIVQGVGYRFFVLDKAVELGLKGWVKNNDEGVEAVFQSDRPNIEKMIDFCWKGPSFAQVKDIKVKWENGEAELEGFVIK